MNNEQSNINPADLWFKEGYNWTSNWQKHLTQPVSKKLAAIIARLLQPEHRQRYQFASEVLGDLNPSVQLLSQPPRPKKKSWVFLSAASLLFLGGIVFFCYRSFHSPRYTGKN
jgi:hypothetical protein